jgi:hypothetical protein
VVGEGPVVGLAEEDEVMTVMRFGLLVGDGDPFWSCFRFLYTPPTAPPIAAPAMTITRIVATNQKVRLLSPQIKGVPGGFPRFWSVNSEKGSSGGELVACIAFGTTSSRTWGASSAMSVRTWRPRSLGRAIGAFSERAEQTHSRSSDTSASFS